MEEAVDVIGIGNPILDHLLTVDTTYLDTLSGDKHGMETVSYDEMVRIIEKSGVTPRSIPGGSCANVIKGLSSLGNACAMIGKIGQDEVGKQIVKGFQELGIRPLLQYSTTTPTAQVVCLLTPDGERTCRSYLGAGQEMTANDLNPNDFLHAKLVHIEGYALLCKGLLPRATELAKEAGALVSFDLGSFEMVQNYRHMVFDILKECVDIVFANKEETWTLTGQQPKEGCNTLKNLCKIAVVMVGNEGCWIGHGQETFHCPSHPFALVDRTGAGDLFASGFLHGYLLGKSLDVCAQMGSITGGSVVEVIGAEIPQIRWPLVRALLQRWI